MIQVRLDTIDWKQVTSRWRESGRTPATISRYLYWARRYVSACLGGAARLRDWLTESAAKRFFSARVRAGDTGPTSAVRALACALAGMGHELLPWRPPRPERPLVPLVADFVAYRLRHRGVAIRSAHFDATVASAFLRLLGRRRRAVADVRLCEVDAFVESLGRRWAPISVAAACSTLRALLDFLFATGRCKTDLSPLVMRPRVRRADRPSRALPWSDVRRILRAIDVSKGLGARDYAMFLMMATYGMGAGEIRDLKLEDIDWVARTLRVRRPKTGTDTTLPLLDPVARALARYLPRRPAHACHRNVFVSQRMPHAKLSASSAIWHRLALYAARAGVRADFLGTHVFRHTHATRQIESGATAKVVGDILGHRRPESTSAYVRSAIVGLRAISLPVPA